MKKDLTGRRFGRLVAVKDTGKRVNRNAIWLCRCDCGGETNQRASTLLQGLVKSCGCYGKEIAKKRMSGSSNPMWKGDEVGLGALHTWVRKRKPKPEVCECCQKRKPQDLANISQKYKRDIADFEWICRQCHMEKDTRRQKLIERNKKVR